MPGEFNYFSRKVSGKFLLCSTSLREIVTKVVLEHPDWSGRMDGVSDSNVTFCDKLLSQANSPVQGHDA